jgi:hypothetical protein
MEWTITMTRRRKEVSELAAIKAMKQHQDLS